MRLDAGQVVGRYTKASQCRVIGEVENFVFGENVAGLAPVPGDSAFNPKYFQRKKIPEMAEYNTQRGGTTFDRLHLD